MQKFSRFTPMQVPITAGPTRKARRIAKKRPKIAGAVVLNFCVATPAIGRMSRRRAGRAIIQDFQINHEAAYYIAHPQIRSRGTICGSIAHADPAAELPALALALDAEMTLTSAQAARIVSAETFFQSFFTTALESNEILTEVRFPPQAKDSSWSVLE